MRAGPFAIHALLSCAALSLPTTAFVPMAKTTHLFKLSSSPLEEPQVQVLPEIFHGVVLPNGQLAGQTTNPFTLQQVIKFAMQSEAVKKPLEGASKEIPFGKVQELLIEVNELKSTVPSGSYKFFGREDNQAKALTLLLKSNPFMASALTAKGSGFELKSFDPDEKNPSHFLECLRTLNGVGRKVNFEFDRKMEIKSLEVFDEEGQPILGELDVDKYACSALYNVLFYAQSLHATIHVLHFLMTSALEDSSKEYPEMHEWAKTYSKNIGVKYGQVAFLLINDAPLTGVDKALISGTAGFGSSQAIRPILKKLLDTWASDPTAKGFVEEMFPMSRHKMERAGILTEFMKHVDLIKPFATEAAEALQDINEEAFHDAERNMREYFDNCGTFKGFKINTFNSWIQLMSITGIVHGGTLSYTRLMANSNIMKWRDIESDTWTAEDVNVFMTGLGTIVGMEPGRHVMTSTEASPQFDPKLQDVLNEYDGKTSILKADYIADIIEDKDFNDYGWILTDYGPDDFDGKQLTIATYI